MHNCICTHTCPYTSSDKLTLILVRWFTAHPDAWDRDMLCRPICIGPLQYNHCLWRYSTTSQPRRVMTNQLDGSQSATFTKNRFIFSRNPHVCNTMWMTEQHAYYGLITSSSIVSTVSMSREYDSNSMNHTNNWIETVTLV